MMTAHDKKIAAVVVFVIIMVAITAIGTGADYNKCEQAGGEYVRGWFMGNRCLIVEREVEL